MTILYLFTIQNLNYYPNDRNYAIISKEKLYELEEMNLLIFSLFIYVVDIFY